ncbi:hypothetical protein WQ57_08750 [Mesobacillus campisalis]|uniref:Uncharacterized protein n=1 Tax=Mesobacillus campisalis TaxID=1408103 RepID=A0A0M2SUK6_9BACI|nr:hypothetical protein WQ57_08750 [Mesobacillus campisalis]
MVIFQFVLFIFQKPSFIFQYPNLLAKNHNLYSNFDGLFAKHQILPNPSPIYLVKRQSSNAQLCYQRIFLNFHHFVLNYEKSGRVHLKRHSEQKAGRMA